MKRKCTVPGCDYKVGSNGPTTSETEIADLDVHIRMVHEIPIKMDRATIMDLPQDGAGNNVGQIRAPDRQNNRMKDEKIPNWVDGQSFESWEENFRAWRDEVGYTDKQFLTRLVSMLTSENVRKDVKSAYLKVGEWKSDLCDTTVKVVDILREKFGQSTREKFRLRVKKFREFQFSHSTLGSMEAMEEVRHDMREILGIEAHDATVGKISDSFDKVMRHICMSEGMLKNKFSEDRRIFLEQKWEIDGSWQNVRKTVKEMVIDLEKGESSDHISETAYMWDRHPRSLRRYDD